MAQVTEVTLLAQAERDLFQHYADAEEQAPGRGDRISEEVEKLLALLSHMPRLGRIVGTPYRRMKLSRFPFSLIYVLEGRRVFIHTIASNHEPLEVLLRRLRQR